MAMTAAEKMRAYRQRKKEAGLKQRNVWVKPEETAPDMAEIREQIKAELKKEWEPELKAERIAAERKAGRELAKKAEYSRTQGRISGICEAAVYFIGKERADIAQSLLSHFMIDRETAAAALEADKRTKSLTLANLDKAGAWKVPMKDVK